MPELPEVETVRRGLERLVVSRTISSVEVKVPKMIKTSYDSFLNDLPGQTIQAMRRRGKYLIFDFGQLIMISDRKKRRVGKECRSRWSPYH